MAQAFQKGQRSTDSGPEAGNEKSPNAGGASSSLTASFLQQLSQEELEQLKEAFKVDMQLFGYT